MSDISIRNDGGTAIALLNKVPEATVYFWIIKILCTTVGETAADFLNTNLNLGLTGTTLVMSVLLGAALVAQFVTQEYNPIRYWLVVVLVSIVGTLITDNLTDNFGVSLVTTTVIFSVCLAATFTIWYMVEGTLSIHAIDSVRREFFYWSAILFTFALGTAAGDLIAERLNTGYWKAGLMFAVAIAMITVAHKIFNLDAVLAFWAAYIITRPLGASVGDYLSQPKNIGGLGLGTVGTSALFLGAILCAVVYISQSEKKALSSVSTEFRSMGE